VLDGCVGIGAHRAVQMSRLSVAAEIGDGNNLGNDFDPWRLGADFRVFTNAMGREGDHWLADSLHRGAA